MIDVEIKMNLLDLIMLQGIIQRLNFEIICDVYMTGERNA
jgi:hypothetical protein